MTFKTTQLRDAITFALAAGATALAGTGVAYAQETEQQATTLDRIEVTGSRIRQVEVETAQPVLTISRQDIERQGFQSVADILQNISAAGSPALSRASPLSAGENVGGSFVSLRGLNAQRTLILVNGKRLGISTSGFQDISTIPTSAVERIEVLKDGASSVYGSDAMAGVVNIITRTNYDGLEANAYYGQYSQGDGEVEKFDFVLGSSNDRGSLTMAFEYAKENPVAAQDRDFAAYPQGALHPTRNWTVAGAYGGFVSTLSQALPNVTYPAPTANNPNPGVRVVLREGGDPANPADYRNQNTNTGASAADPEGSTADKTNTNLQTDLRTPLTRKSVYISGSYELTDTIRFLGDVSYTNRQSGRQVAGYPFQAASFNTPMSADSYFNPLDQDISTWWRRTWEVPRYSESDLDVLRFTGGLQGSFDLGERYFDWDVGYLYSNNRVVQSSYGNLNLNAVRNAVGPSFVNAAGQVQCGTALNPIPFGTADGQCTPWNPFLAYGVSGPGALTGNQQLMDYLFQEEHSTGDTTTQVFTANISGNIVQMPAGDLAFAAGVERRKENGGFTPDALSVSGGSTNLGARATRGGYSVDEVYGELFVPILDGAPGAHELNVTLASRYSDYDTFGDTVNSKFGVKWRPIEQLLVRGTWSQGFRAPTIANLYAGGSQSFSFYTDPCDPVYGAAGSNADVAARCAGGVGPQAGINDYANFRQLGQGFQPVGGTNAQTPLAFFQGAGNPSLQPESSTSKTVGLVWSPEFTQGLNMSLDWWQIRIDDTIVLDAPTTILNDCYVSNIIDRCSVPAGTATGFTRDPVTGIVNFMQFGSRNAGYREVEGWDFDLTYRFDTDYGNLALMWQTTYLSRDEFKSTDDDVPLTQNVSFASSAGTTHRLRSNANLAWTQGDFGASWGVRYYSGLKESCLNATLFPDECSNPTYVAGNPSQTRPINELGSNTFHDVQFRWNAPWNATVSVGANNVFGHVGQQMYSQPNANVSYNGEFDIGRFLYMKYQQRF